MTNSLPKISTHLGYFGSGSDRYNPDGYKKAASPAERIRLASKMCGLDGVELKYPALVNEETVDEVSSVLAETVLSNLKRTGHPENLRVISDTIFGTLDA